MQIEGHIATMQKKKKRDNIKSESNAIKLDTLKMIETTPNSKAGNKEDLKLHQI